MRLPCLLAETTAGAVPPALLLPFVVLLLLIAVVPLGPDWLKHWWEKFYPFVAVGLGLIPSLYYLFRIPAGHVGVTHTLLEYLSFICLIGALFVTAGGIHIRVKGDGTPFNNTVFLALGAVVANLIGTTGASMLMIRPWIRMNHYRFGPHHVVFFIFIVSNCGGALTPIGDPPLFLGYLSGVPFFWLFSHALLPWVTCNTLILVVFYFFDRWNYAVVDSSLPPESGLSRTWEFDGLRNIVFLLFIIGAVFLPDRFFLRELVMVGAAALSYLTTPASIREANNFSFAPVKEVAWLFIGIFLTMRPALDYLALHGQQLGFDHPLHFYFATGSLSAVLDNAPTYMNFLNLAQTSLLPAGDAVGPQGVASLLAHHPSFIVTVSLGAVFFGAMTYIGNGPNFMVKSIAENAGVQAPSFFGYILRYSLPVLLPILMLVGWMFT
ncbi:MAG: sodium:proton antiporter [Opitutae bacterium]|nr:sodium:proton antiporter [Opitutae bacterium]